MPFVEPLAKKLLNRQLFEILRPYVETFTLDEHIVQQPINNDIKFDVTTDGPYSVAKVFNLKWHEGMVTIKAYQTNSEFMAAELDTFGRKASYGELQDVVGTIAHEVYQQLHRYATENNFPPENVTL